MLTVYPKYIKEKLMKLQWESRNSQSQQGDFNIAFLKVINQEHREYKRFQWHS